MFIPVVYIKKLEIVRFIYITIYRNRKIYIYITIYRNRKIYIYKNRHFM